MENKKKEKNVYNYLIWLILTLTLCNFYLLSLGKEELFIIVLLAFCFGMTVLLIRIPDFVDYLETKFGKKEKSI